jgi:DNA-binding transcriptional LysR family regulator
MRNLDTSLLRAFVAVADTAGMTAAGNLLHLTQAAVSQQIKRLEEALGAQLFERDRRGLRLTDAGERLYGRAKRLLALNDEIWAEMTAEAFTGEVRLGIPYDLVGVYLPPVLKSFTQAHPHVQITLICRTSPELVSAVEAGEVDVAVVEELSCGPDGEHLATDRLVWVGARGGDAYTRRPLPVSFGADTCALRPAIFRALRDADIPWRAVSEIGNMDAMNVTVQTDLAVTAVLASTISPGLEVLGPRAGLPVLPAFSINLYMPRTDHSGPAQALAHGLREGFTRRSQQAA